MIIGLVSATALGLAAIVGVALDGRRTWGQAFPPLLSSVALFNLVALGVALPWYVRLHSPTGRSIAVVALVVLLVAVKVAWLVALASAFSALIAPGRGMVEKAWTTWAVTLLTAYLVLLGLSWMASRLSLFEVAVAVGEVAIIALAIGASVFYLQKSRTTGARQRSIRSFARIHLAVFTVTTLTWVLGMVWTERAANWSAGLAVVLLGSYNLSLLAWSRVCALSTQLPGSELFSHYGITAREREIVDLISAGHTNREIADRLFISPATVKDHNHNVFRKTGVRNRVELANLFRSVDQNDEKAGAD